MAETKLKPNPDQDQKEQDKVANINEILTKIELGNQRLGQVQFKNIIIVIGKTGQAKSTTVNYILGKPLIARKPPKGGLGNLIVDLKENHEGAVIGHGQVSETTLPNIFVCPDDEETVYVDCPGFDDNKGPIQDIPNAFYIKKIAEVADNFKIVLIVSADTFNQRTSPFSSVIKNVTDLFPEPRQIKDGLFLIITKIDRQSEVQDVRVELSKILEEDNNLTQNQSELIEYFASESGGPIGLFRKPEKQGDMPLDDKETILASLAKVKAINRPKVSLAISDKSKWYVSQVMIELGYRLTDHLKKVFNETKRNINSLLENPDTYLWDQEFLGTLQSIRTFLGNFSEMDSLNFLTKELPQKLHYFETPLSREMLDKIVELASILSILRQIDVNNYAEKMQKEGWSHQCLGFKGYIEETLTSVHELIITSINTRVEKYLESFIKGFEDHLAVLYKQGHDTPQVYVKIEKYSDIISGVIATLQDVKSDISASLKPLEKKLDLAVNLEEFRNLTATLQVSYVSVCKSKLQTGLGKYLDKMKQNWKKELQNFSHSVPNRVRDYFENFERMITINSKEDIVCFQELMKQFKFLDEITDEPVAQSLERLGAIVSGYLVNNKILQEMLNFLEKFLSIKGLLTNESLAHFLDHLAQAIEKSRTHITRKLEQDLMKNIVGNYYSFFSSTQIVLHKCLDLECKHKSIEILLSEEIKLNEQNNLQECIAYLKKMQKFVPAIDVTNLNSIREHLEVASSFGLACNKDIWNEAVRDIAQIVSENFDITTEKQNFKNFIGSLVQKVDYYTKSELQNKTSIPKNIEILARCANLVSDFIHFPNGNTKIKEFVEFIDSKMVASSIQFNVPSDESLSVLKDAYSTFDYVFLKELIQLEKNLKNKCEWLRAAQEVLVKLSKFTADESKLPKTDFISPEDFNSVLDLLDISNKVAVAHGLFEANQMKRLLEVTIYDQMNITEVDSDLLSITGNCVKMSNVIKHVKESHKTVIVYCLNTIKFDCDFVLPGGDLVIIAPRWHIEGKFVLNLSGKPGVPLPKAKNGDGFQDDGKGKNGEDGLPGLPGSNGGHLYGIGLEYEYLNNATLTINVNGGDGSPGQEGGDGAQGKDGVDATEQKYRLLSVDETLVKRYTLERNVYEVKKHFYGTFGCKGGDGGRGGKGGKGGKRGNVILYFARPVDKKIPLSRKDGLQGKDGEPGQPGQGGKHGDTLQWIGNIRKATKFAAMTIESEKKKMMRVFLRGKNGKKPTDLNPLEPRDPEGVTAEPDLLNEYKLEYLQILAQLVVEDDIYLRLQRPVLDAFSQVFTGTEKLDSIFFTEIE